MSHLPSLLRKKSLTVIGLMSGTSVDGIDAVVVKITGAGESTRLRQIASSRMNYPSDFRRYILENSNPGSGSVDNLCRINTLLSHFFARAARTAAEKAQISMSDIDLIGCHGQTIHHLPHEQPKFGFPANSTLQVGDIPTVATLTGVPTAGNFRPADMAVGGEGAPLVPYLDFVLLRSQSTNRLVLNLGGIANITALRAGCRRDEIVAFDTGPGNMVVDGLMSLYLGVGYDRNGAVASRGNVDQGLLRLLMSNEYFQLPPPKSTGRELFGEAFTKKIVRRGRRLKIADVIATATEFTALSVYDQYVRFIRRNMKADELVVSGGGVRNRLLMDRMREKFYRMRVRTLEEFGWSSTSKEALLCALLAYELVHEHPASIPSATGARRSVVLGSLSL